MVDKRTDHEVIPSARRLITSLRDEGYDFVTAAADIIDNSIQANATEIDIKMEFNGDSSWFRLADNGAGMSADELTEAMRFGTKKEYTGGELGKFGLGLKTASISQCRRLTVASRNDDLGSEIEIRQFDLDRVEQTDRWEIQSIPVTDYSPLISAPISDHSGTVILWEKLDRMMTYDPPDGMRARKGFLKLERELEEHLSVVFHRFISGELGNDRKVVIRMEKNPIRPWDPFARDEKETSEFEEKTIAIPGSDRAFSAHYTAYLLPTKAQFSTPEAWRRAAGPNDWNFQQGFYIYRENRLIQSGGWNRMRTADEHTKYARIALDLHADADFTLSLNIMKSNVLFPPVMKESLKEVVENLCSLARKIYTPDRKDGEGPVSSSRYKRDKEKDREATSNGSIGGPEASPSLERILHKYGLTRDGNNLREPRNGLNYNNLVRAAEKLKKYGYVYSRQISCFVPVKNSVSVRDGTPGPLPADSSTGIRPSQQVSHLVQKYGLTAAGNSLAVPQNLIGSDALEGAIRELRDIGYIYNPRTGAFELEGDAATVQRPEYSEKSVIQMERGGTMTPAPERGGLTGTLSIQTEKGKETLGRSLERAAEKVGEAEALRR